MRSARHALLQVRREFAGRLVPADLLDDDRLDAALVLATDRHDAALGVDVELVLKPGRLAIQPKDVDKGGLLKQALAATRPDFVLVIGDDQWSMPIEVALWRTHCRPVDNPCHVQGVCTC